MKSYKREIIEELKNTVTTIEVKELIEKLIILEREGCSTWKSDYEKEINNILYNRRSEQ